MELQEYSVIYLAQRQNKERKIVQKELNRIQSAPKSKSTNQDSSDDPDELLNLE
jgi:hypothetical protein